MVERQGFGNMLVGLSVLIQRRYVQVCADHDLTPAQGQLLCMLKDQPQRMARLATLLGMTKSALSQLVDRTERRGLVHRESPEPDRRVIVLGLTPVGRHLADALYADIAERLPDVADGLDPDDRRQLERLATAIAAAHLPAMLGHGTDPAVSR